MKKSGFSIIGNIILVLFFIGAIFGLALFVRGNCRKTLQYSVVGVDGRFNISKEEVLQIASEAADKWNYSDEVLEFNDSADLKIELVYDTRQADLDSIRAQSDNLQKTKSSMDSSKEFFDKKVANYQSKLISYNNTVQYWNSRGGAPATIYTELQKQKNELDIEREDLLKISNILNIEIGSYNQGLENLKSETDQRRNLILTQGVYIPSDNKIEIYTFGDKEELRLVLMHELGHALGMDHATDPNSVMHYLLSEQDLRDPLLTEEDRNMLNSRCDFTSGYTYYRFLKLPQIKIRN